MLNHEKNILCPYCGETVGIILDISAEKQEYFEDCFVCCRPILVRYECTSEQIIKLEAITDGCV
ncbi:MAG: hypothetical protein CMM56_10125 [Rhodospirillaceae bacterium]|nr:hypothetical protein [Rhodospirillaceae bacterium]|tara:strand:+ start:2370 stop:2561 length:192 start_codon:yes stop_codon:yes gene_type:complete